MLGASSGGAFSDDLDQMFGEEVPSVSSFDEPRNTLDQDPASIWSSTLDEDVYITLKRDVLRVAANLQVVLLPYKEPEPTQTTIKMLRDWDLWGPFVFVLLLASLLSLRSSKPSQVFSLVFCVLCFGSATLNLNVLLLAEGAARRVLRGGIGGGSGAKGTEVGGSRQARDVGGNIMFFQSLSLIGYCLFPMDVAALLCLPFRNA
eukprot:gene24670-30018_t